MNNHDSQKLVGRVTGLIEYNDGTPSETVAFNNTILMNGRIAIARSLANEIGSSYQFFISRMIFGSSGTSGGVPKHVDASRNGLFGLTALSKPVIAKWDAATPTLVVLTSVIGFDDVNGTPINEMALQMKTGDLYSMRTFPDITKTDHMQLVWNWHIEML